MRAPLDAPGGKGRDAMPDRLRHGLVVYRQVRAGLAVLFGAALVVVAVPIGVQGLLPAAVLMAGLGLLLAAAGVILFDTTRSTETATTRPASAAPLGGRGRATTVVGVTAGALAIAGAICEYVIRSSTDGVVLTVGGALLVALGVGLPRLAREPVAPVDPVDAGSPAPARRRSSWK